MNDRPLSDSTALAQRIEGRIDREQTHEMGISSAGGIDFTSASQFMEFAKMMALAGVALPKHLRENPGACLAVAMQASEWKMSPFQVANKSYSVNDRLAYEAQLINAVILRRAPIKSRFRVTYEGEAEHRKCTVEVTLLSDEVVSYTSPAVGKITVKNSPLWKSDVDQQLFYFSSRSLCRRHFPDVLLGVYTPDEIEGSEPMERPARGREIPTARSEPLNPFAKPEPPKQEDPPEEPFHLNEAPPSTKVSEWLDSIERNSDDYCDALRHCGISTAKIWRDVSEGEHQTALNRREEVGQYLEEVRV